MLSIQAACIPPRKRRLQSTASVCWKYGLAGPTYRRRTRFHRASAEFDTRDLAAFVALFRHQCKLAPSAAVATTINGCKSVLHAAPHAYLANRCAPFVAHLMGCVIHAYGHQLLPLAEARAVKDALVDFLFTVFTKLSATSLPLTDQLVAIFAETVFRFRFGPAACASPSWALFASLVPICGAKKTVPPVVFIELFCVCTCEVVEVFLDVIHHYCTTYDRANMAAVSAKLMACLAVFAETDAIRHFELQAW